mmetsp:Transcript_19092/g.44483  ORF Transcript_19092/g.44483 Transcript_19092/m.44483 type:complete len:260 (+) Transcript_19092:576-1355(+)
MTPDNNKTADLYAPTTPAAVTSLAPGAKDPHAPAGTNAYTATTTAISSMVPDKAPAPSMGAVVIPTATTAISSSHLPSSHTPSHTVEPGVVPLADPSNTAPPTTTMTTAATSPASTTAVTPTTTNSITIVTVPTTSPAPTPAPAPVVHLDRCVVSYALFCLFVWKRLRLPVGPVHLPFVCMCTRNTNPYRNPTHMACPHCHETMVTRTRKRLGAVTILWVIALLCICWPLFWLPFLIPACQSTEHYCTRCNRMVGTVGM